MKRILVILIFLAFGATCFGTKKWSKDIARWLYIVENHPDITYDYCQSLINHPDPSQQMSMLKLMLLRALANRGHVQSLTDFGQMYLLSTNEEQREKGRRLLIKAAKADYKPACCILSRDYFMSGYIDEGITWLAKALAPTVKIVVSKDRLDFKRLVLYDEAAIEFLNEVKSGMCGQNAQLVVEALAKEELRAT